MRTITTDKGITYEVEYTWTMAGDDRTLSIALKDKRPLSQLAAEFEGLSRIHFVDEKTGEMDFLGYTRLVRMDRRLSWVTRLLLMREEE